MECTLVTLTYKFLDLESFIKDVKKADKLNNFDKLKTHLPITNLRVLDFRESLKINRKLRFRQKAISDIKIVELMIKCFDTFDEKLIEKKEQLKTELNKFHTIYKTKTSLCRKHKDDSSKNELRTFMLDTFNLPDVPTATVPSQKRKLALLNIPPPKRVPRIIISSITISPIN